MTHETTPEPTVTEEKPLDKVLDDHVKSLRALATVHQLLSSNSYQLNLIHLVHQSLEFISVLHQQVLDEALKHPDVDQVPELAKLKQGPDAEKKDPTDGDN